VKPLLIGESNPYGADPEFALYPLPEHASGGRLARIFGMSRTQYLRMFDRVNLCSGDWSMPEARKNAFDIEFKNPNRALILLGRKVALAFGLDHVDPFTSNGNRYLLPHPSGLNRVWAKPESTARAREILRAAISASDAVLALR
jgi:hypothetical protein